MEQGSLEKITTQLQDLRTDISKLKKLAEWSLALSFMAAISHAGMELYGQTSQFWEDSPLFLDVLNVARERAKASFVQAEIRHRVP